MRKSSLIALCFFGITLLLSAAGPQRVLSLAAAGNDLVIKLGAGNRLAAIDDYGRIVPGTAKLPSIGKSGMLSREAVLAHRIDGAIVWYYQTEPARMLRQLGIPVLVLPALRYDNYRSSADAIRQFLELPESAMTGVPQLPPKPQQPPAHAPVVYFELYSPGKTVSGASYLGDLIRAAGGRNLAENLKFSGAISMETVLAARPDVIFYVENFGTAREMAARPGFTALPAVKNQRIIAVPRRFTVAGLHVEEAIRFLKAALAQ